ncbi:hypothetical protein, partial [Akkermansia sp.]|uniref:hypothetical protein n=1 Tax=Akkermansia sp. TaxID=1872421 RepID=UPI003AB86AAD
SCGTASRLIFHAPPASKTASSTNTVRTFMNSGMKPWRGRVRLTWLYAEIRMEENSAVALLANEGYLINQNWTRYEYKDSRHGRQGFPVAETAPERLGKLGQGNAFVSGRGGYGRYQKIGDYILGSSIILY